MIPPAFSPQHPPRRQVRALLEALELPGDVAAKALRGLQDHAAEAGAGRPLKLCGGWSLRGEAAGGLTLYGIPPAGAEPLSWLSVDRGGHPHALWRWGKEGLAAAALRLPGEGWLEITPGAARHPLWGRSDGLAFRQGGAAREVACCRALDYARIGHIPPLDRPGHLPPGAGEAFLNAIAVLLAGQGTDQVKYDGPYPTAQLFHSLSRSFRCPAPEAAPHENALETFTQREVALAMAGRSEENPVPWQPAPFAPFRAAQGVLLHLRDGVETVWLGEAPFRKASGQGGAQGGEPAGQRVWSEQREGTVLTCVGLVLLGAPFRRYLVLDEEAKMTAREPLPKETGQDGPPVSALWRDALFAWAALHSTAALAPAIGALEAELAVCWAPLPLALASASEGRLLLQQGVFDQLERVGPPGAEGALMLISDVLAGAEPHLRRMAQQRLEQAPPPELAPLVRQGEAAQAQAQGRLQRIMPALVSALLQGQTRPQGSGALRSF